MKNKLGTTEYIWIGGTPYTAVAVAQIINGGTPVVWSIFRDNLGTITHVKNGTTIQEYSFDAYGRRRNATNWSFTLDANDKALFADRGFTGHEHLTQFGLINMNGRLYDPLVGRFLSPDNFVQNPSFTQSYNRYGYCLNNPLRFTDPSGNYPREMGDHPSPCNSGNGYMTDYDYTYGSGGGGSYPTGWYRGDYYVSNGNGGSSGTMFGFILGGYGGLPYYDPKTGSYQTYAGSMGYYKTVNAYTQVGDGDLVYKGTFRQFIPSTGASNVPTNGEVYAHDPGEIRPYEPNIFERFSTSAIGKSIVGRVLYGVVDDAWVTAQCFTIGHNNAFHLSGAYTIGNETVNAGVNTMTNFVPLESFGSYLGIGEKTLNAGQFNALMKGTGITSATDGGAQILLYNNSIRQSIQFNKMWNYIGSASTVVGYW